MEPSGGIKNWLHGIWVCSGLSFASPVFLLTYILLTYICLMMFQGHSKVIQLYIYTYAILQVIFHHGVLQDINYSFLCYTVNLCCMFHIYFLKLETNILFILSQRTKNVWHFGLQIFIVEILPAHGIQTSQITAENIVAEISKASILCWDRKLGSFLNRLKRPKS